MTFHVAKSHRRYNGEPYYDSFKQRNCEFNTIEGAREAVKDISKYTPCGWNIYDAVTGELVETHD